MNLIRFVMDMSSNSMVCGFMLLFGVWFFILVFIWLYMELQMINMWICGVIVVVFVVIVM